MAKPAGPPAKAAVRRGQGAGAHGARARSASMPRAASPAPPRCPSTAPPGRRCACRATATGAIPSSSPWWRSWPSRRKQHDGWPGLLVGDMSQPRGGPMLTGHASHQVGLDADIWLTPMPDRRLSEKEREDLSATSMLAADKVSVDPKIWTDAHVRLIKRAASLRERRAHLRASRHQEGAVRGHRQGPGPRLAAQGAGLLGPLLPFPRAHRLPEGQHQLRGAAAACRATTAAARSSPTGWRW